MNDLDILLSMIENPTRRRILETLVKEPQYPFQLSKELGISQQAVMKNLSVLEKNGMVVSYRESSSIGPERTVYEPNSEFSLYVDMRNGMFTVRVTRPEKEESKKEIEMKDMKIAREKISDIDKKIEKLDEERSKLIRERESLISSSLMLLNDSYCGYGHKSLMYEILNEPERTIDQLSSDLGVRKDAVEGMIEDIEKTIKEKKEVAK